GVRRVRAVRRKAGFLRGAGRAAGAVVVPGPSALRESACLRGIALTGAYVSLMTMAKPRTAADNKAARAEAKAAGKAAARQRRAQLWQAFTMQRKQDKRLLPYMIGAFVLIVGVSVAAGVLAGGFTMITLIPLGVVLGALVAFIIFTRRAQKSIFRQAEGQ